MVFDYDLMFIDDKEGTQTNISEGTLGTPIDLTVAGQGKGHRSYIAILFTSDTTATDDPSITFSIETSKTCDFAKLKEIPLALPTLTKADLTEGTVLSAYLPVMGLERFVRLKIGCESPIACMGIRAGYVLDTTLE